MPDAASESSRTIIVRKYGGSSLATVERLRTVAHDIAVARAAGNDLVVVVSAMGQTTDELDFLAHRANPHPPRRELDMLLSVGERITMSLLCMALAAEGCPAISFTGSQCGIITDNSHTDARIREVRPERVRASLAAGLVVVVAGFQGVSLPEKEITTLGRGGSDTTAVALAAALGAARCEILKDVEGLSTADPKRVPTARRHPSLSYGQLIAATEAGCGVVHPRAAQYAAAHDVPLFIGSSFEPGPGTEIGPHAPPAAGAAAAEDYRPVTLVTRADVRLVTLAGPGSGPPPERRERVLGHLPGAEPLAEWLLRDADGWRWSVLADADGAARVPDVLVADADDEGSRIVEDGIWGSLALAGNPPLSWLVAERMLSEILVAEGIDDWRLRSEGSALRLLVPSDRLDDLAQAVHHRLFPA